MTDLERFLQGTRREMGVEDIPAGAARSAILSRRYEYSPAEVWAAITEPEPLSCWFLPVDGDLHEGGTFRLEGNANGDILRCTPSHELLLTWVFDGFTPAQVRVLLEPTDSGGTDLTLTHASVDPVFAPDSETWSVGVAYDIAFWALDRYLRGEMPDHPPTEEDMAELGPMLGELAGASGSAWASLVGAS